VPPLRPQRSVTASTAWIGGATIAAAALLYYAARGVDWRQIATTLAAARPGLIAAVCLLSTVTLWLRSARWRILLNAEGRVPRATVFWATAAGYFGNSFLPARAGEIVRTVFITSASELDNAYVLATALSERIADAIALLCIVGAVLMIVDVRAGWIVDAARAFAAVGAVGALFIVVLPLTGSLPERLLAMAPLPDRLRTAARPVLSSAIRGLRAFHSVPRLSGFLLLTCIIWSVDAFAAVMAGAALGLHIALPISFLILAAVGLASAVPSTPGYVGVYQFVAVMVLSPFGISRADAIAFIIVLQATSYATNAFWGSFAIARYRRATRDQAKDEARFVR